MIARGPLPAGALAPDFRLLDARTLDTVRLGEVLAQRRLMLMFVRSTW